MRKFNDFIELEPGYFIEKDKYDNLIGIGVLPWEMRAYIRRQSSFSRATSQAGRPLKFQQEVKKE